MSGPPPHPIIHSVLELTAGSEQGVGQRDVGALCPTTRPGEDAAQQSETPG